jgi:hypothetical protein
MPEVIFSDEYEAPALDWLFAQVARLKTSLDECGVSDEVVQRAVCETFFFALTVDFDGGSVDAAARPRPRLSLERDGTILLPADGSFDFHDYALGAVGEAFGDP